MVRLHHQDHGGNQVTARASRTAIAAIVYTIVAPPLLLGAAITLAARAGWLVIEEDRSPHCPWATDGDR